MENLVLQHRSELEGSIRRDLVRLSHGGEMTFEESRIAISSTRHASPRAPRFSHQGNLCFGRDKILELEWGGTFFKSESRT